eukprot:COSAG02_NODE_12586_length_1522_cov_1.477161_2_plen_288_part_00
MPRAVAPSAMPLLAVTLLGIAAAAAAASLSLPRALSQPSLSAAASSGDPCGTGAGPCSPCKKHRGSCCGSFPNGSFCCAGGAASIGGVCKIPPVPPVPPECTSPAPFLPRYHFIGPPSAHLNAGNEGSGFFPDNANDANALFYHGGYLHAMHQTATLWGNPRAGRDKGGSFEHFSHLISRDFAHWERLPDACRKADSKPWNSNPQGGCYDGAVSLLPPPHGPIMLYEPRPYGVGKPIPLILVKAVNASDPKLINWDQNNSKIVHLKIAPPGSTLRGWCNTSTNAISL